jgi:hypothetical protein
MEVNDQLHVSAALPHPRERVQCSQWIGKVKGKVVPHEAVWGSRDKAPPFLTATLDGGEWSASRTGHFTPRERAPSTHWIKGWVGPQGRSGRWGEQISCP